MIKEKVKIQAGFKAGGSIVSLPPVFSNDSQYVLVARKNTIISYNTKTYKKFIEFTGLRHDIIGFGCSFVGGIEQVIACTRLGHIILWKANTGLKLKEFESGVLHIKLFKIYSIYDEENIESVEALICYENKQKEQYEVKTLNIQIETLVHHKLILNFGAEIDVDVGGRGQYIVATQDRTLYFYSVSKGRIFRHKISNELGVKQFTRVVCHPEDEVILTGDSLGRVLVWHNLKKKSPVCTNFHWHTLPVKSIAFSTSGTKFYSGGSECVLVQWMLENSTIKQFIPRLPGHIEHITVSKNNLFIALSTSDNGIQIVSPQLNILGTIQYLVLGQDVLTGLTYDFRNRALVLNGICGHIQFFCPKNLVTLYSLDVVGDNKYTHQREVMLINTAVTKVAMDKTGLWMATVEHRADPELFECRLKFWFFSTSTQSFTLNTSVEYPHEGDVLQLMFQPSNNEHEVFCVTVGEDRKFKIWQVLNIKTVYREGYVWQCSGEVSYRQLAPNALSFSFDGTLIAVGFESIITTWLPDSCELKCSLSNPQQKNSLSHLSFGTGAQCHLLFSASSEHVSVWNLLSLAMEWCIQVNVTLVISDILSSYKAVFTQDKQLLIFETKSFIPVYNNKKVLKSVGEVQAATFVPKIVASSDVKMEWYQRSSIYVLNTKFELHSIEQNKDITESTLQITEDKNRSFFSHILPELKVSLLTNKTTLHSYVEDPKSKALYELLDTPPHAFTSLQSVSADILKNMIKREINAAETGSMVVSAVLTKEDKGKNQEYNSVKEVMELFDDSKDLKKILGEPLDWTVHL